MMHRMNLLELDIVVRSCLKEGNLPMAERARRELAKKVSETKRKLGQWRMNKNGSVPPCPLCRSKDAILRFSGTNGLSHRFLFCNRCHAEGRKESI